MKKLQLLVLASLTCFLGCNSKNYPANDLPENQIIFGSGGGFTGEVKQYILLENGQLFQVSTLSEEISEIDKIGKKEAKSYFKKIDSLRQISFNHPGNRYYFITRKSEGKEDKVVWGNPSHEAPQYVKDLYSSLIYIVQPNN